MNNQKILSADREKKLKADAREILANSRRTLLNREPFIGSVMMQMDIIPSRDIRVRTAATDGRKIFFDIAFMSTLSSEDIVFVLGHEAFHAVMCHFARTENRNRELMNVATDLEVNQILSKDGFSVPQQALMPGRFNLPPDLAAEEYYELLLQYGKQGQKGSTLDKQFDKHVYSGDQSEANNEACSGSQQGQGQGQSQGQDVSDKYGKVGFDPDVRFGDPKDAVERIREAVVGAAQVMERTRGTLPGYIKGLVQALLKPEINWREQLQQFVTRTCCGEKRDWNPPNRRHVHSGLYLQSRKGEKIRVYAGLDVSGSTASDIPKFLGELNGLVKSFGKYELTVAQADTEIKKIDTYTDDDPLDLENEKFEVSGGGGTILKPLLDEIENLEEKPDAILILTDGGCEHFTEDMDPGVPVMWLVTKGGNTKFADFGDVTEFKEAA